MKIISLWIVAVFLPFLAAPDAEAQQVTPIEVLTLDCKSPKQLLPGDKYCLQIELDSNNYDAGIIDATFKQVEGPTSSTRYSGPMPRDSVVANAHLLKHQTIYTLRFDVTEDLAPGKWKLTRVIVGQNQQEEFKISKNVTFDILAPSPIVVHARSPQTVEAGETYNVTVTMDEWTKNLYKGCVLTIGIRLKPTSPGAQAFGFDDQALTADKHSYTFSYSLASDFPGGSVDGDIVESGGNDNDHFTGCRYPELKGDTHFEFKIEPNKNFKPPTSVEVIVNPSQIQLLSGEIDRLNAKAQNIKEELRLKSPADRQALLLGSLADAMTELAATKKTYKERGKEPSYIPAINIFFGDIERTYRDARKTLANNSVQILQAISGLKDISLDGSSPREDGASDVVLAAIQHNVEAYEIATSSKVITFNLDVYSEPPDAKIAYRIEGDDDYTPVEHHTDWQIENLPLATYEIRLQLPDYQDYVTTFEAVRNTGSSINARLIPNKRPVAP